jgi:hypothetical protein
MSSSQEERVSPADQTWDLLESYREPEDRAWCWGFCEAAMRGRLLSLATRAKSFEAEPAEIDELLMLWQILRGFPVDYAVPEVGRPAGRDGSRDTQRPR